MRRVDLLLSLTWPLGAPIKFVSLDPIPVRHLHPKDLASAIRDRNRSGDGGIAHMAHALVLKVKFAEGWDPDQVKMLEEIVVPLSRSQPGFKHGVWMHDDDSNGMGVIVFASAEEAEAAKSALNPPQEGRPLSQAPFLR